MKPLFAIAPLALVLILIGPSPDASLEAIAAVKARLFGSGTPEVMMRSHETNATDAVVLDRDQALVTAQHAEADIASHR